MKINKAIKALFGAVIVSAALSSCSAASVEELLSPPRLDEEQTAIYEALRTAAGGSVSLKYPKSGQYRSAFVVENIDGEPTNEAIVFYEKPNVAEGASIRINFLDMQEEKWVSVYDFAASGSEVECCVNAKALLKEEGIDARVVSMPSFELFEAQSDEYKESVMPAAVRARVAVEAASSMGWHKYVGLDGATVTLDHFGASAPAGLLFKEYGFTAENVAATAKNVLGK